MKYAIQSTYCRTNDLYPHGVDQSQMTKKRVHNNKRHQRIEEIWMCVHMLP